MTFQSWCGKRRTLQLIRQIDSDPDSKRSLDERRDIGMVHPRISLSSCGYSLREIHLGLKPKRRTGPSERLQAAYEKVMAKRAKG
jgi:hypothetical protein